MSPTQVVHIKVDKEFPTISKVTEENFLNNQSCIEDYQLN